MGINEMAVLKLRNNPGEEMIFRVVDVLDQAFGENVSIRMLCCDQTALRKDMFTMHVRAALVGGEVWVAGCPEFENSAEIEQELQLEAGDVCAAALWFGPEQELMGGPVHIPMNGSRIIELTFAYRLGIYLYSKTAMEQAKQGWFSFQAKLPSDGMRAWWMEFVSEYSNFTRSTLSSLPPTCLGIPNTSPVLHGSSSSVDDVETGKGLERHDWGFHNWHLTMIGVLPKHQGKGLGKELVSRILEKAKSEHIGVCLVTDSLPALQFYERLGFQQLGKTTLHGYQDVENINGHGGAMPIEPIETVMMCLAITPEDIHL